VKLLLDTCTFLWLAADDPQLSPAAIKHRLGRLPLPEPPPRYVASRRSWLGLEPLDFDAAAATHDALLPHLHRDPFDRGLVSQAILLGLSIVTPDPTIACYPAPILW
jgi:PIN domain nuclease of toxin-antitoxin system